MAKKRAVEKRVYMPRYYGWVITAVLGIVWTFLAYSAFYTKNGQEKLGVVGFTAFSTIFTILLVFMWLLALQKLPISIIREQ